MICERHPFIISQRDGVKGANGDMHYSSPWYGIAFKPPEQAAALKIAPLFSQKWGQVRRQPTERLSPPFPCYSQETRKKIFPAGSLMPKYSRPDPPREGCARASVLCPTDCHHPSVCRRRQAVSEKPQLQGTSLHGLREFRGKKSNYSTRKYVRRKEILLLCVCNSEGGVRSSACSTAGSVTPERVGLLWGSSDLKHHSWS